MQISCTSVARDARRTRGTVTRRVGQRSGGALRERLRAVAAVERVPAVL